MGKSNIREACAAQNVPQNELDSCVHFVRQIVTDELKKQKKCSTDSDCFVIVDRADRTAPLPKKWESRFISDAKRFAKAPVIQLHAPQNEPPADPASLLVSLRLYKKNGAWKIEEGETTLTVHQLVPHTPGLPCLLLQIERKDLPTAVLEIDDPFIIEDNLGLLVRREDTTQIFVPISTDVRRMTLLWKRDTTVDDCFAQRKDLEVVAELPGWTEAIKDCRRRASKPEDACGAELEALGKPARVWQGVPLQRW